MHKVSELQMYDATDQDCVDGLLLAIKACEKRLDQAYIKYGEPMTKAEANMLGCMVCALEQAGGQILEEMTEEAA